MKNYYSILDVRKNASGEEIKQAYRQKVKSIHPDVNPNNKNAGQNMAELNEAYKILSDKFTRHNYDLKFENGMKSKFSPNKISALFTWKNIIILGVVLAVMGMFGGKTNTQSSTEVNTQTMKTDSSPTTDTKALDQILLKGTSLANPSPSPVPQDKIPLKTRQQCSDNANRLLAALSQQQEKNARLALQNGHRSEFVYSLNQSIYNNIHDTCFAEITISGSYDNDKYSISNQIFDTISNQILAQEDSSNPKVNFIPGKVNNISSNNTTSEITSYDYYLYKKSLGFQ